MSTKIGKPAQNSSLFHLVTMSICHPLRSLPASRSARRRRWQSLRLVAHEGGTQLEFQDHAAQLNAIAVTELPVIGHRHVVDTRELGRRSVVHEIVFAGYLLDV